MYIGGWGEAALGDAVPGLCTPHLLAISKVCLILSHACIGLKEGLQESCGDSMVWGKKAVKKREARDRGLGKGEPQE